MKVTNLVVDQVEDQRVDQEASLGALEVDLVVEDPSLVGPASVEALAVP